MSVLLRKPDVFEGFSPQPLNWQFSDLGAGSMRWTGRLLKDGKPGKIVFEIYSSFISFISPVDRMAIEWTFADEKTRMAARDGDGCPRGQDCGNLDLLHSQTHALAANLAQSALPDDLRDGYLQILETSIQRLDDLVEERKKEETMLVPLALPAALQPASPRRI